MEEKIKIKFNPELDAILNIKDGKFGLILAHGMRDDFDKGILPFISKKLSEKKISSVRFRFPFKINNSKVVDEIGTLDESYLTVWRYVKEKFDNITWLVGGIDIGSKTAIRSTGLMMMDTDTIPAIVSLNYPLYPPNRPELVEASTLGAVMGDALFIQASNSNQGSFDRLKNSINMMIPHADIKKINHADHEFNIENKTHDRVAFWISNDIERYIRSVFG
ncbi:MAG: alpha/beta family hydrolase [Asgard group archaeon]|nr:alpha/beta family hydrolase [Asgard group archaeon]